MLARTASCARVATAHPIEVDADRGPGYLPEERTSVDDGVLELDLAPVLAFIEEQVAALPPGIQLLTLRARAAAPMQIDVELARRIVDGWTSDGTRGHRRLAGGYTLQTVIGLHDLHFVLAGNEDFDSFLRRVRGTTISLSERDTAAAWAIGSSEQMRTQRMPARIVDQGLGGYRLLWERGSGGEGVRAKVGELVGLAIRGRQRRVTGWPAPCAGCASVTAASMLGWNCWRGARWRRRARAGRRRQCASRHARHPPAAAAPKRQPFTTAC